MRFGIDVVDIERLRAALARRPGLEDRLFDPAEVTYCRSKHDPVVHLAGRLAAKEATMKVLRVGKLPVWARRITVESAPDGAPVCRVRSTSVDREIGVSISHDGGSAVAIAWSS
ncbi:MAG: 4'-phosphopantetheinyl transferase superfamily protein [Actinomycetota bacterium]|nr:4'-phosphopantetheinyl transferase superfamily protein [Actinomycetota bacterium]